MNIAGGCCGNTPEHIAAIAKALENRPPRALPSQFETARPPAPPAQESVTIHNLETLPLRALRDRSPSPSSWVAFMMIGERTNVSGSPKFAKLVKDGKYEEAVSVARQQVENGANVIDICMDEGMIDGAAAMTRFSACFWRPSQRFAKVPFMIDSSKWSVIEAGLKLPARQGDRELDLAQRRAKTSFKENARTGAWSTGPRWWSWPSTNKGKPRPTQDKIADL